MWTMLFKIILHYIDTAIFALRYFILLHLAYNLYEYNLDTINSPRRMGTEPLYNNTYGDSTLAIDGWAVTF